MYLFLAHIHSSIQPTHIEMASWRYFNDTNGRHFSCLSRVARTKRHTHTHSRAHSYIHSNVFRARLTSKHAHKLVSTQRALLCGRDDVAVVVVVFVSAPAKSVAALKRERTGPIHVVYVQRSTSHMHDAAAPHTFIVHTRARTHRAPKKNPTRHIP